MEPTEIEFVYRYHNKQNQPLFEVVRLKGKRFLQRRPDPNVEGRWVYNLDGVRRVPYRLPELLNASKQDFVYIVEGEKDVETLVDQGLPATCLPGGSSATWWAEYNQYFEGRLIAIIPDNDEPGRRYAQRIAEALVKVPDTVVKIAEALVKVPDTVVKVVQLPDLLPKGDVSDWLDAGHTIGDLHKLTDEAPVYERGKQLMRPIDASRFQPMSSGELVKILGLTIKADEHNKLITFLAMLSAYTEDSQINISFNAPSSTGKSYIPLEIARLFPEGDVREIGYCSPTSFFHDTGRFDKDAGGYIVDLSHRILIFLDQPHTLLLQHLRPLLSHDKKEIVMRITDKTQKYGLRTKNILLIGYPAVIFCSAGLKMDEQEATRFLLLSPETSAEKIQQAVHERIRKAADSEAYQRWLDENPERGLLKDRILAIRQAKVKNIKIAEQEKIEQRFLADNKVLKPRHARDIGRLIALIKIFTLLNVWFRERDGDTILANDDDIDEGFKAWSAISESQELGLPPYVLRVFREVIVPAYEEKNGSRAAAIEEATGPLGLSREEIRRKHYEVYGRHLPDWQFRREILPALETAGLVCQESDPQDKRRKLVYPTLQSILSDSADSGQSSTDVDNRAENNIDCGVGYFFGPP